VAEGFKAPGNGSNPLPQTALDWQAKRLTVLFPKYAEAGARIHIRQ